MALEFHDIKKWPPRKNPTGGFPPGNLGLPEPWSNATSKKRHGTLLHLAGMLPTLIYHSGISQCLWPIEIENHRKISSGSIPNSYSSCYRSYFSSQNLLQTPSAKDWNTPGPNSRNLLANETWFPEPGPGNPTPEPTDPTVRRDPESVPLLGKKEEQYVKSLSLNCFSTAQQCCFLRKTVLYHPAFTDTWASGWDCAFEIEQIIGTIQHHLSSVVLVGLACCGFSFSGWLDSPILWRLSWQPLQDIVIYPPYLSMSSQQPRTNKSSKSFGKNTTWATFKTLMPFHSTDWFIRILAITCNPLCN